MQQFQTSRFTRRRVCAAALAGAAAIATRHPARAQTPAAGGAISFRYLDLQFTVPDNPQRVVVMEGRGDLELATIAGLPVVASANTFWPDEQPGSRLDGYARPDITLLPVGDGFAPSFEDILLQDPDLIVMRANGFRNDWYGNEQLAAIAPLLAVEVNRTVWREDLTGQMAQLGRQAAAAPFLERYDAEVAEARQTIDPLMSGKTVAFITATTGNPIPLWTNDFAMAVCEDLGLDQPFFDKTDDVGVELSAEQLTMLKDIDLIMRQVESQEDAATVDALPTWQLLPAVKAGHVYDISPQFNTGSAITAR
ncbi:MAG: ABC transporter substrate-binding protein, partial [Thermomicrobiales bacterium]